MVSTKDPYGHIVDTKRNPGASSQLLCVDKMKIQKHRTDDGTLL
jgi:hypothetical protein